MLQQDQVKDSCKQKSAYERHQNISDWNKTRFSLPHGNNHQGLQKELNSETYLLQPITNYLFKDKLFNNLSHIDHHNNEAVLTERVMIQPFMNQRIFYM